MELDVLYTHIASPAVVANFPALARRIANKELVHGAGIIVGIHTRLLKKPCPRPVPPKSGVPSLRGTLEGPPAPAPALGSVEVEINANEAPRGEEVDEKGLPQVDGSGIRSNPSGTGVFAPWPLETFAGMSEPTTPLGKPAAGWGSIPAGSNPRSWADFGFSETKSDDGVKSVSG